MFKGCAYTLTNHKNQEYITNIQQRVRILCTYIIKYIYRKCNVDAVISKRETQFVLP